MTMEAKDMLKSSGENNGSVEEELKEIRRWTVSFQIVIPHS